MGTKYRTIDKLGLNLDNRVVVRLDLDVPLSPSNDKILNEERLERAATTIKTILARESTVIIMGHLGRPKGKVVEGLKMQIVRDRLSEMIGVPIVDMGDPVDNVAMGKSITFPPGSVGMVENVRFNPGEEENTPEYAQMLARLGDCYLNDAFAVSHRAHASIVALPDRLPPALGPQVLAEIEAIEKALDKGVKPSVAIVSGIKISDKIKVLSNLAKSFDKLLLGGGLMAPFIQLQGGKIGGFDISQGDLDVAKKLLDSGSEIVLPTDFVVLDKSESDAKPREVAVSDLDPKLTVLDIGKATVASYSEAIAAAKKIVWNGPLGYYEDERFQAGTVAIARAVAANKEALKYAGGGSTVGVIRDLKIGDAFTHISTGGGAFLEMLGGNKLVGIEAIAKYTRN